MARKSRSTGVGKGNGVGSAKTQYKPDMPSGNVLGRPCKPKPAVPRTMDEAVSMALAKMVIVTENGREKTMPQMQAMVELLLSEYARASFFGKMSLLRYLANAGLSEKEHQAPIMPEQALQNLVKRLAEEAEQDGSYY